MKLVLQTFSLALALVIGFSGCSSTKYARDLNGLSSPDGQVISHLSTSNVALHFLVGKTPIAGDATLAKTVENFTAAAKAEGATKVRIVQSDVTSWYLVFFPFSLLITPVTSNVAGEAIR